MTLHQIVGVDRRCTRDNMRRDDLSYCVFFKLEIMRLSKTESMSGDKPSSTADLSTPKPVEQQRRKSDTTTTDTPPFNDWSAFAMELWGIQIETWNPAPERGSTLPVPLDYDVLQVGLIELNQEQRQAVLQGVSCYQVVKVCIV